MGTYRVFKRTASGYLEQMLLPPLTSNGTIFLILLTRARTFSPVILLKRQLFLRGSRNHTDSFIYRYYSNISDIVRIIWVGREAEKEYLLVELPQHIIITIIVKKMKTRTMKTAQAMTTPWVTCKLVAAISSAAATR